MTLVLRVFGLWRQTDGWRRGYEQHMSTWLNDRGWEKEPTEAELHGAKPVAKLETWDERRRREQREENERKGRELAELNERARRALEGLP